MLMKKTMFQRNVSAYFFAFTFTVILCLLITGIIYIDCCANDTIMSAHGLISPIINKIIDTATSIFNL